MVVLRGCKSREQDRQGCDEDNTTNRGMRHTCTSTGIHPWTCAGCAILGASVTLCPSLSAVVMELSCFRKLLVRIHERALEMNGTLRRTDRSSQLWRSGVNTAPKLEGSTKPVSSICCRPARAVALNGGKKKSGQRLLTASLRKPICLTASFQPHERLPCWWASLVHLRRNCDRTGCDTCGRQFLRLSDRRWGGLPGGRPR